MSRLVVFRQAARMAVAGVGPGACIYTAYALRPPPIRLDAGSAPPFTHRLRPRPRISSSTVQQLSSGSLAGFGAGVLVALFSRTLAFVAGLLALSIYMASRYGIDLPQALGIKRLFNQLSWWERVERSPWFTGSFALTFTMASFVHL